MRLYDLKTGTNTRRVRIFLAEKGLKLPTVEVDMLKGENKDPEYLSKNPMGTMPLLELDDGTQLAESADWTSSDRDVESANGVRVADTDN